MDSPESHSIEDAGDAPPDARPAPRWYQRALLVTGLGALAIGLAVLAVPGFREQVELSTSRQPQPYVELYFTRSAAPNGQAVCLAKGRKALVRFVVGSHLATRQAVTYRVTLSPSARGGRTVRKAGSVGVTPDTSTEVVTSFARPRGAYTVSVTLPALDQVLRARCPGRT